MNVLVQKGANPNITDNDGYMPIHLAIKKGELDPTPMINYDAFSRTYLICLMF